MQGTKKLLLNNKQNFKNVFSMGSIEVPNIAPNLTHTLGSPSISDSIGDSEFETVVSKVVFPNSNCGYIQKQKRPEKTHVSDTNDTNEPIELIRERLASQFSKDASEQEMVEDMAAPSKLRREITRNLLLNSKSHFLGISGRIKDRISDSDFGWLYLLLLGLLTGILGFMMDVVIELVGDYKKIIAIEYISSTWLSFACWVSITVTITMFVGIISRWGGKYPIGSGIPEMRSVLGSVVSMANPYLSARTLILKIVGLSLALGAGMWIGKEGPFVHIAAVISSQLLRLPIFHGLRSNLRSRRQLIAVGCAVGVAANFGSPIGGVLFSIEVTLHYYATQGYFRSFTSSVIAGLTFSILVSIFISDSETLNLFHVTINELNSGFDIVELLPFFILGVIEGILGGLFVYAIGISIMVGRVISSGKLLEKAEISLKRGSAFCINMALKQFPFFPNEIFDIERIKEKGVVENRIFTLIIVSLVTSLVTFPYLFGDFMSFSQSNTINDIFMEKIPVEHGWHSPNIYVTISFCFFMRYIISAFSTTLPIPCGLYLPALVLGALSGRFYGEAVKDILSWFDYTGDITISPVFYGIVGAAAFAAGLTRTISSALIVAEITGKFDYILPMLLAVLTATIVGNYISPGAYDYLAELNDLPFLSVKMKKQLEEITVEEIMKGCYFLTNDSTYIDALDLINHTDQRDFPVLDNADEMNIVGSINRSVLQLLIKNYLQRGGYRDSEIESLFVYFGQITAKEGPYWSSLVRGLFGKEKKLELDSERTVEHFDFLKISGEYLKASKIGYSIKGNALMHNAPHFIECQTDFNQFQRYFALLNLRFCYITNKGRLMGMVELENLLQYVTDTFYS